MEPARRDASLTEQALSQFSELTYGARHAEELVTSSNAVSAEEGLRELHVTAERLDQEGQTVLDTVAGGIDIGSRGIKKLVDVVGGEEKASLVMTGVSLLVGGPLKTAAGMIMDKITGTAREAASKWLSGALYGARPLRWVLAPTQL